MTNRVLLDKDKLLVSKAGVDVLLAEERDLLFDSRKQNALLYATGTVSVPGWNTEKFGLGNTLGSGVINAGGEHVLVEYDASGLEGLAVAYAQRIGTDKAFSPHYSVYVNYRIVEPAAKFTPGTYGVTPKTGCLGFTIHSFSLDVITLGSGGAFGGSIPGRLIVTNYSPTPIAVRWTVFQLSLPPLS